MAIKKIKIGDTTHELQTTIANVDGLQAALDELENTKADSDHTHGIVMADDSLGNVTISLSDYDTVMTNIANASY